MMMPYVGLRIGSEVLECMKMYYGFYESIDESEIRSYGFENFEI
jgi:hypothetical protein